MNLEQINKIKNSTKIINLLSGAKENGNKKKNLKGPDFDASQFVLYTRKEELLIFWRLEVGSIY